MPTGVLDILGQSVMPQVFAALRSAGLNDSCTITAETTTAGTGGGVVKSGTSNAYTSVPCTYEPLKGARIDAGGKLLSLNAYTVTMPTYHSGSRINLDPKNHALIVDARGSEPAKTFRIVSIADESGVIFEVLCEKEN